MQSQVLVVCFRHTVAGSENQGDFAEDCRGQTAKYAVFWSSNVISEKIIVQGWDKKNKDLNKKKAFNETLK